MVAPSYLDSAVMALIVAWRTAVLVPLVFSLSVVLCLVVTAGISSLFAVVCVAFVLCVQLCNHKTLWGEVGRERVCLRGISGFCGQSPWGERICSPSSRGCSRRGLLGGLSVGVCCQVYWTVCHFVGVLQSAFSGGRFFNGAFLGCLGGLCCGGCNFRCGVCIMVGWATVLRFCVFY